SRELRAPQYPERLASTGCLQQSRTDQIRRARGKSRERETQAVCCERSTRKTRSRRKNPDGLEWTDAAFVCRRCFLLEARRLQACGGGECRVPAAHSLGWAAHPA